MKLILSHLQQFLPDLSYPPEKIRDDLSMIGHFCNYYEKVEGEIVFDLDIKVNRGDCLGYYGLARDLSVYYNLPLQLPNTIFSATNTNYELPIKVTSPDVTRIMSIKISNVKVGSSPDWLIKFIKLHNINSVNNLVDLTNYAMFLYGIPSHAFDTTKCTDNIIWENNHGKTTNFTTLDGTILKLYPENLVISNPDKVLSTDLVGGKNSGITDTTTDIIIEVAIYNRVRVRRDSKQLKTVTEASIRLEKDLDPDTIPLGFNCLASLILKHCSGQISSSLFDYYPQKTVPPTIAFSSNKPSQYSGIDIPSEYSFEVLKHLGCTISDSLVTPPSIRKDLTLEEDLIEEVVRFWGYNKIPTNQPLQYEKLSDITPKILSLIELLKDNLVALGYDEVRSWPLVQDNSNSVNPFGLDNIIRTQNSINSEFPNLRQSLITSLLEQIAQYGRYKLPKTQYFEIGKIFYLDRQQKNPYQEKYSVALYHNNPDTLIDNIKTLSKRLSINLIDQKPGLFIKNGFHFFEIYLDHLVELPGLISTPNMQNVIKNSAYELTSQIITLDANVVFSEKQDPQQLLQTYVAKINPQYLWNLVILDVYEDSAPKQFKYTVRAYYYNLDDKSAKKLHQQVFSGE